MASFKYLLLASSLLALSLIADVQAAATTSIKVAVTFPTGSAGATVNKLLPSATKISACTDATKIDAVTFTVTYNAADPASTTAVPLPPLNLYVFLYNPDSANKYYSVTKTTLGSSVTVTPYANVAALTAGAVANPYLAGTDNFAVSGVDSLFGSHIKIDGVLTGTWQLIGILANPASSPDFDNPATWAAWDVATVIFGMPWNSTGAKTCV